MKDVVGWRIDDVVELIRGNKGTPVRLDVMPAERRLDAKPSAHRARCATRCKLEEQAAKAQGRSTIPAADGVPAQAIGVIKLPAFYQDFEGRRKNGDRLRVGHARRRRGCSAS